MIEQKEAVIFDLDGTMTDSMWIWEEIDQDFFRQQGLPMPEHLHEEIEGMSFTEIGKNMMHRPMAKGRSIGKTSIGSALANDCHTR